jgi:hypothetical protein
MMWTILRMHILTWRLLILRMVLSRRSSVVYFFFLANSRLYWALHLVRGDTGLPLSVTAEGEQVLEATRNADRLLSFIFLLAVLLGLLKPYKFANYQNMGLHLEPSVTKVDQKGTPMNSNQKSLCFSHMRKSWGQNRTLSLWMAIPLNCVAINLHLKTIPSKHSTREMNTKGSSETARKSWKIAQVCFANFMPHKEYYGDRFPVDKTYFLCSCLPNRNDGIKPLPDWQSEGVSNVYIPARIQERLKDSSKCDSNQLEFGGISVIVAGDFNQLGPVLKDFIPTTMMLYALRRMKTETIRKRIKKIIYISKKEKSEQLFTLLNDIQTRSSVVKN